MVINKKQINQAGVTLIEMLVVIAIFGMISSVLLFNYSDFSTGVSLKNLTQDVALTLRKAQTYATSVQSLPNGSLTTDFPSYGMSFSANTTSSGNYVPYNKRFVLFADIPVSNKKYDASNFCGSPSAGNECVDSITITSGDKIVSVCSNASGSEVCSSDGTVDISFQRPSPDAIICYRTVSDPTNCVSGTASYAKIILQSAKGISRSILIWNTGQIATQ